MVTAGDFPWLSAKVQPAPGFEEVRLRLTHPATVFATLNNGSSVLVNSADNRAGDLLVFGSINPATWPCRHWSPRVTTGDDG